MPKLKLSSPSDKRIDYKFHSSGPITNADDAHEDVDGNVVKGHLSTGDDVITFKGVPVGFEASAPWDLDIKLDLGNGYGDIVPTFLNAVTVEIRSQGAHYWISHTYPGMILRDSEADDKDSIMDVDNTFVCGNVRNGGVDSWRVWPHVGFDIQSDHDIDVKFGGQDEWTTLSGYTPEMSL